MKIEVYSDGSAQTAATPGGWGSVVLIDGVFHTELSGYMATATNNDAEMAGAVFGLDYVLTYLSGLEGSFPLEYEVTLISDSEIILNWANGTYRFKQIEKIAVYDHLRRLVKKLNVKTQWVRGHNGNVWNERCDKLANNARKGVKETIDKITTTVDTKIGTKKTGTASVWFRGQLMVLDFESGIIEPYSKDAHGKRGSVIEIREGKDR